MPAAAIKLTTAITVEHAGKTYTVAREDDTNRVLHVYDAGPVCHELRGKRIMVSDEQGMPNTAMEIETALCAWQDCLAFTVLLLNTANRLPLTGDTRLSLTLLVEGATVSQQGTAVILACDGKPIFALLPAMSTALSVTAGQVTVSAFAPALCLHILPLDNLTILEAHRAILAGGVQVTAHDAGGQPLPVRFDPIRAAHVVDGSGIIDSEETRVFLSAETDSAIALPVRVLLAREAHPRIKADGSLLSEKELGLFSPLCSYPVSEDSTGKPTGMLWQVSTNIHEFADFPQPYTRCWLHLYHQGMISRDTPLCEQVRLYWASLGQRPAAQFLQLSLLGWDDHPRYGGGADSAVQLWHQGIINHQEITCLNPDAYMCGNAITDIRPIDYSHDWGPNQGGGDFLRYRVAGDNEYRRLQAPRTHFENYGPYLGTIRYFMTSEDNAITGEITAHIQAAADIARVYFDAHYRVNSALEVTDLTLIWLGCPSYDFTASDHWAYGQGRCVLGEGETRHCVEGEQTVLLPAPVVPGMWFASYGGGVIDEQDREPNANRGLVFRGGHVQVAAHAEQTLCAMRVFSHRFKGTSPQFRLGIFPREGVLRLTAGDTIDVRWEYVPILKRAQDVGDGIVVDHYRALLEQAPDHYQTVIAEAIHGEWALPQVTGAIPVDAIVPTLRLTGLQAEFTLLGGFGWLPLRVQMETAPGHLILEEQTQAGWCAIPPISGAPQYQLERHGDVWTATLLLTGAPTQMTDARLRRIFRLRMKSKP